MNVWMVRAGQLILGRIAAAHAITLLKRTGTTPPPWDSDMMRVLVRDARRAGYTGRVRP